jgi:hypothetical protein
MCSLLASMQGPKKLVSVIRFMDSKDIIKLTTEALN